VVKKEAALHAEMVRARAKSGLGAPESLGDRVETQGSLVSQAGAWPSLLLYLKDQGPDKYS
jgi:hypothetical protein